MKLIKRVQAARGIVWSSRKGWFWLSFGGEIYSFSMELGRFHVSFERKYV